MISDPFPAAPKLPGRLQRARVFLFAGLALAVALAGCGGVSPAAAPMSASATANVVRAPAGPAEARDVRVAKQPAGPVAALLAAEATPSVALTASPSGAKDAPQTQALQLYEQQVLFDKYGVGEPAILLNRQAVVVNRTGSTQKVRIVAPVTAQVVQQGIDFVTRFPILADLIPKGDFAVPADDLIHVLPAPNVAAQTGKQQNEVAWDGVEVAPGHAVLASLSSFWGTPADVRQGNQLELPGLQVDPQAQLSASHVSLVYDLATTQDAVAQIRFGVFLPSQIATSPGAPPDTLLYKVIRTTTSPGSHIQNDLMGVDGRLNMSLGTHYLFPLGSMPAKSRQKVSIEADVERTGRTGTAVPYLTMLYASRQLAAPPFQVEPSPRDVPVEVVEPLFYSNVSISDTIELVF